VKTQLHDASARQHSGEPSSGLGPNGGRKDRLQNPDLAELDYQIAGLVDRSTTELRCAWRTLHHTGPPLGLSRDLIVRGLADKLQQRAHGGPSRALQRRLQILAGEFEKRARSFDPGIILKTGATLVRQWRGYTHTVLVREDGFEYDGRRYRSLTVIAEQIHPQFWGYLCLDFEDTYARYCVLVQRLGRTVIDGIRPRKLGSHWTLRWRKPDSNPRSLLADDGAV